MVLPPALRLVSLWTALVALLPAATPVQQSVNPLRNGGFEEGPAARTFLNLPGGKLQEITRAADFALDTALANNSHLIANCVWR